MNERNWRLKRLCVMAMICAMAYVIVATVRIPVVQWLSYEPKDVLIAIGAFLFGPLSAAVMSVVVSLVEMVTISDTGIIGMAMNVLSTCLFVCTAGMIYRKNRRLSGAIIGLIVGSILTTAGMLLWNYLITPLYLTVTRDVVAGMLLPIFLPFNLFKSALNSVLTVLVYKHIVTALRAAKLIPPVSESAATQPKARSYIVAAASAVLLALLIVILLMWNGII